MRWRLQKSGGLKQFGGAKRCGLAALSHVTSRYIGDRNRGKLLNRVASGDGSEVMKATSTPVVASTLRTKYIANTSMDYKKL